MSATQVLIDCRPVRSPVSGVARYCLGLTDALVSRMQVDALVQGSPEQNPALNQLNPAVTPIRLHISPNRKIQNLALEFGPRSLYAREMSKAKIVHETYFGNIGRPGNSIKISTIQDTIPLDKPEFYSLMNRSFATLNFHRQVKEAHHIIAISHYTKSRVIELSSIDPDRITVIGCGVQFPPGANFIKPAKDLESPYVLYLGNIEPRKNLSRLVDAFSIFRRSHDNSKLIVAGKANYKAAEELERAQDLLGDAFCYMGMVDEAAKWRLIVGARLMAFPSLYEGFGIPIIESYAVRTPIIFGRNSSMCELAVDDAQMFDALSVDDIARALKAGWSDDGLRERISTQGEALSKTFTWSTIADAVHSVYNRFS